MHGALDDQVEAQSEVIQKAEKSGEKPLGFGLTTANQFVQYLGGELRFKSFPWFKTEAIFSFPIKMMMMPKSQRKQEKKKKEEMKLPKEIKVRNNNNETEPEQRKNINEMLSKFEWKSNIKNPLAEQNGIDPSRFLRNQKKPMTIPQDLHKNVAEESKKVEKQEQGNNVVQKQQQQQQQQ